MGQQSLFGTTLRVAQCIFCDITAILKQHFCQEPNYIEILIFYK